MICVVPVPTDLIDAMWPHVTPFLAQGAPSARVALDDIRRDIDNETDRLWVVFQDEKPVAAFVTAVFTDQGSYLGVYALGGRGLRAWAQELETAIRSAAAALGVACIRFRGRAGWSRVLPDLREIGRDDIGVIYERAA